MNLATILQLIAAAAGIAEQVIPIFVHNSKSQQIEAVIFSDVNAVLSDFGQVTAALKPK